MIASAVRGNISLAQSVAPKGARGIAIHAPHAFGHIPPGATTKNLFSRAQAIFQRNVPRLTRWLGSPQPMAEPISLNRMAHRTAQSVQERMSFSSRMVVSRPLKAAGMPRPPVIARSMHEVGLGTARKFSSQTVFHHFVENTSITTRAFWEANWDLKAAEERKIWVKRAEQKKSGQTKRASKSSRRAIVPVTVAASIHEEEDDMSLYFPHPAEPSVTTFLQIALASTPSATLPLAAAANNALYLLPLRSLLDTHAQFQARTQDVTAIFTRLDAENVWNRGVTAETWGDTAGLCVELRVKFSGWSEQDVRSLLGGLIDVPGCAVQEYITPTAIANEEEDHASQFSPAVTQLEFVMPTASFDSEPITHSSSPSVSDITFLDLFEGSIPSGMVTPHSAGSMSDWGDGEPLAGFDGMATPHSAGSMSEWGDSEPFSVFDNQPNTMLMSLSSAFLVRLQEVEPFGSPM